MNGVGSFLKNKNLSFNLSISRTFVNIKKIENYGKY